jgi:hypothetical protein
VSIYSAQFHAPHADTADIRIAWDGLQTYLDPARWQLTNRLEQDSSGTGSESG